MYIYIYIYMYVCMYVCMHVCMYVYIYIYQCYLAWDPKYINHSYFRANIHIYDRAWGLGLYGLVASEPCYLTPSSLEIRIPCTPIFITSDGALAMARLGIDDTVWMSEQDEQGTRPCPLTWPSRSTWNAFTSRLIAALVYPIPQRRLG